MEVSKVIDLDYDDLHNLENVIDDYPDKGGEAVEELAPVTEAYPTEGYGDLLTGDEKGLDDVFWGVLAALCFLAGLAVGLLFHFKNNWATAIGNYLQRCCPRLFTVSTVDPVLLTVVERKTTDENECDEENRPESTTKDAEMCEASVEVKLAGGGGEDALADHVKDPLTEAADHVKDPLTNAANQTKETEADDQTKDHLIEAADQIKETEAAQDWQKTEDAHNDKVVCEDKSSSSSSSEAEGDEESSVRHRKKTAAEATEGEVAAPESDDKDDGQHKE